MKRSIVGLVVVLSIMLLNQFSHSVLAHTVEMATVGNIHEVDVESNEVINTLTQATKNMNVPNRIVSPNGKYEAIRISFGRGSVHYRVKERSTGRTLFTTFSQYRRGNDVKGGAFSADSTQFAAAYHYGHRGKYTWIGVWTVKSGRLNNELTKSGFIRSIPTSVFGDQGTWWKVGCACEDPYRWKLQNIQVCMVNTNAASLSCGLLAERYGGGTKCNYYSVTKIEGPMCNPIPDNFTLVP